MLVRSGMIVEALGDIRLLCCCKGRLQKVKLEFFAQKFCRQLAWGQKKLGPSQLCHKWLVRQQETSRLSNQPWASMSYDYLRGQSGAYI